MSPAAQPCPRTSWRFPRVSGDEPSLINHEVVQGEFSPRERG